MSLSDNYVPFGDDDGLSAVSNYQSVVVETDIISQTLYTELSSTEHDDADPLWQYMHASVETDEEEQMDKSSNTSSKDDEPHQLKRKLPSNTSYTHETKCEPTAELLQKMRNAGKCKTAILLPVSEVPTKKPSMAVSGQGKLSNEPLVSQVQSRNTNPAHGVVTETDKRLTVFAKRANRLNVEAYKGEHDYCSRPSDMYKRKKRVSECETFGNVTMTEEPNSKKECRAVVKLAEEERYDCKRTRTVSTTSTLTTCSASNCSECDDDSSSSSSSSHADSESSGEDSESGSESEESNSHRRSWLHTAPSYHKRQPSPTVNDEGRTYNTHSHTCDRRRNSSSSKQHPRHGHRRKRSHAEEEMRRSSPDYSPPRKVFRRGNASPPMSKPMPDRSREEILREREDREEVADAMDQRRILFVGDLRPGTSRRNLVHRFSKFGHIRKITMHEREDNTHYGFITFKYRCDAFRAKEEGNDNLLPSEPIYSLNFGGRRFFCDEHYQDLDDKVDDDDDGVDRYGRDSDTYYTQHTPTVQYSGYGSLFHNDAGETDFDALLNAAKSSVSRK